MTDNEISSGENVIKCKSIACGCETGWVSQKILQKNSLITEIVSSTIDNVLGLRTVPYYGYGRTIYGRIYIKFAVTRTVK